jgi:glucose-6-phosphate 1-dehydrogenase
MMLLSSQHEPTVIVIFGASGDLTQRKVVPALYNLYLDHWLLEKFALIEFARSSFTETSFREHLRQGVDQFFRRSKTNDEDSQAFTPHIHYMSADYGNPAAYTTLSDSLSKMDGEGSTQALRHYITQLSVTGLTTKVGYSKLREEIGQWK